MPNFHSGQLSPGPLDDPGPLIRLPTPRRPITTRAAAQPPPPLRPLSELPQAPRSGNIRMNWPALYPPVMPPERKPADLTAYPADPQVLEQQTRIADTFRQAVAHPAVWPPPRPYAAPPRRTDLRTELTTPVRPADLGQLAAMLHVPPPGTLRSGYEQQRFLQEVVPALTQTMPWQGADGKRLDIPATEHAALAYLFPETRFGRLFWPQGRGAADAVGERHTGAGFSPADASRTPLARMPVPAAFREWAAQQTLGKIYRHAKMVRPPAGPQPPDEVPYHPGRSVNFRLHVPPQYLSSPVNHYDPWTHAVEVSAGLMAPRMGTPVEDVAATVAHEGSHAAHAAPTPSLVAALRSGLPRDAFKSPHGAMLHVLGAKEFLPMVKERLTQHNIHEMEAQAFAHMLLAPNLIGAQAGSQPGLGTALGHLAGAKALGQTWATPHSMAEPPGSSFDELSRAIYDVYRHRTYDAQGNSAALAPAATLAPPPGAPPGTPYGSPQDVPAALEVLKAWQRYTKAPRKPIEVLEKGKDK